MLDEIDREAEREGAAMSKARKFSTLPRTARSDPRNHTGIGKEKELDILRILNVIGRR